MPLFDQQEKITAGIILCFISLFIFSMVYAHNRYNVQALQQLLPGRSQAPGIDSLSEHSYRVFAVAENRHLQPASIVIPAGSKVDFYLTSRDSAIEFEITGKHINLIAAKDAIYKTSVKFDHPGVFKIINRHTQTGIKPYAETEIIVSPSPVNIQ